MIIIIIFKCSLSRNFPLIVAVDVVVIFICLPLCLFSVAGMRGKSIKTCIKGNNIATGCVAATGR